MHGTSPHEALARDRRRYERLLLARMGTTISAEDAEDIVSEALIKAQIKLERDPPKRGREGAWFSRIVLNLGVDFLRARDGRPSHGGSCRPAVVPLTEIDEQRHEFADDRSEAAMLDDLAEQVERAQSRSARPACAGHAGSQGRRASQASAPSR
jgi:DNA-directed RNA polymerase specialized sigma24 family protein